MRLHLARAYHSADNLIIDAVFCCARVSQQVVADDGVYLFGEGCLVFIAADGEGCNFAEFWLAEVDDQVAFGHFIGCMMVIGFLISINKESSFRGVSYKADLSHDILYQRPCSC